jgi:hypothetical protein
LAGLCNDSRRCFRNAKVGRSPSFVRLSCLCAGLCLERQVRLRNAHGTRSVSGVLQRGVVLASALARGHGLERHVTFGLTSDSSLLLGALRDCAVRLR